MRTVTPEQEQAIRAARRALGEDAAGEAPPGVAADAYWRGYLRAALRQITEAFPEGGVSRAAASRHSAGE